MPFPAVAARVPKPGPLGAAAVAVAVGIYAYWVVPAVFGQNLPDGHGTYMANRIGKYVVNDGNLTSLDVTFFWVRRLARVSVDMPAVLAIIFLVLPRGETPITYMGAYTLYSYLFHSTLGFHIRRAEVLKYLGMPVVDSRVAHIGILVLHVPYCLAILAFCTSSYWRAIWSWAISPSWVSIIFSAKQFVEAKPTGNVAKFEAQ
mmetsp:Transcript_20262/g.49268  ORF Transcript_20262/g.49268 Transcript_20262/m.49268 type:complete len:203 (+) Transcript_20262:64-672(+)